MKKIYILLSIIGAVVPYSYFIPFLMENGFNLLLFSQELFANRISTFFPADFFISCLVFWVFLYSETKKYQIRYWWICIIATVTVGLSFALPLFLYFRHSKLQQTT
ncbi:hypothetical protein COM57_27035 [Bacillus pseudomycoides]|uniref:DUF2834 domain-containing protein n=1 Tax=Bacillus pseudomycoides TaxID=64104 RepID=UPI000BF74233|nr:DUF2834 domain-containing protein [Bacillus pseudomycoides]PGE24016.1 hypothetical protein COM57_27035 [Bacillus pseudomycoides]